MKTYRVGGGKTRASSDATLCSGGQTKKGKDARMHINIIFHLTSSSLLLFFRSRLENRGRPRQGGGGEERQT